MLVLQVLEWDLSAVTPYSIMDHLLRTLNLDASFNIDTVRKHAETFVALTATEHIFCHSSPAVVAVACLGAALRGLSGKGMEEVLSKLQLLTGVQKVKNETRLYNIAYVLYKWNLTVFVSEC